MYLRRVMSWGLATWACLLFIGIAVDWIVDMKRTNKENAILADPKMPRVDKIAVVINRSGLFAKCKVDQDGGLYAIYETERFREVRKFLTFMYGEPPEEVVEPFKLEGAEFNRVDLAWKFDSSCLRVSNFEIRDGRISPYGFLRFN